MQRRALRIAALVALLPACQAIWGIDSLSGDGICVPCYTGPDATRDVGACRAGCKDASGACQGEVTPSAEVCSTADVNESCNGSPTCTGKLVFEAAGYTGANVGEQFAAVAADATGGIWATGATRTFIDFNDTKSGNQLGVVPYLLHLDANRKVSVLRLMACDFGAEGWNIALLPDGDPVIVGEFAGTLTIGPFSLKSTGVGAFIARFDGKTGDVKWAKRFATNDPMGFGQLVDVAVAADGTIVACGLLAGDFLGPSGQPFQANEDDLLVARFDAEGNDQWVKTFGGGGNQNCSFIALDAQGGIAMTGWYTSHAWTFGSPLPASPNVNASYVARLSSDGTPTWSRALAGSGDVDAEGVGLDPVTGDVIVGGHFTGKADLGAAVFTSKGNRDLFLARFSDKGDPLLAKRFGDAKGQSVGELRVDGAGQILVTGKFAGTLAFDGCELVAASVPDPKAPNPADAFVAKLAPDGHAIWCAHGGTALQVEEGQTIASDLFGGVVVGGAFHTSFAFTGSPELTCGSDCFSALFFARFAP